MRQVLIALIIAALTAVGQPLPQTATVTAQVVLPNTGPTPGAGADPRIHNTSDSSVRPMTSNHTVTPRPQSNTAGNSNVQPQGGGIWPVKADGTPCEDPNDMEAIFGGELQFGGDNPGCGYDDYTGNVEPRNCPPGSVCIMEQMYGRGSATFMYVGNDDLHGIPARMTNFRVVDTYLPNDPVRDNPPCRLLAETRQHRDIFRTNFSCPGDATATPTPTSTLIATNTPTATPTFTPTPIVDRCTPRPQVQLIGTSRMSTTGIGTTVRVQNGPKLPNNFIHYIVVKKLTNATLDVTGGYNQKNVQEGATITVPAPTTQLALLATRKGPGAFGAEIIVVDECGAWPTFFGLGS